jgi:hypothetical protein
VELLWLFATLAVSSVVAFWSLNYFWEWLHFNRAKTLDLTWIWKWISLKTQENEVRHKTVENVSRYASPFHLFSKKKSVFAGKTLLIAILVSLSSPPSLSAQRNEIEFSQEYLGGMCVFCFNRGGQIAFLLSSNSNSFSQILLRSFEKLLC